MSRLRLLVLTAVLCSGLLLPSPSRLLAGTGKFDHDQAAAMQKCATCHGAATPDPRQTRTVAPVILASGSAWCATCHHERTGGSHPLGMTAQASPSLPLDENGRMVCLTCHSPHRPALASTAWVPESVAAPVNGSYPTFLLLERTTQGELCRRCHSQTRRQGPVHGSGRLMLGAYAGSTACRACHEGIYTEWQRTPHALMTRPPTAVASFADLPETGFGLGRNQVKFALGSHWVHRFVLDATGTLIMAPGILDRQTGAWLKVKDYGWKQREWTRECAGCHTTGFDPESRGFVEPGVGCEACHGPSKSHAVSGAKTLTVNPARLDADRREMVCESCHTSGLDRTGRFHFPAGYRPGDDLRQFFFGLTPKPGQDATNFNGDETYADRRRQWDFLKSRLFLAQGLTCDYCQNFRSFKTASGSKYMSHDQYCLTCHTTLVDHAPAGTSCIACHAPSRTADRRAWSIHDHKFCFEAPPSAATVNTSYASSPAATTTATGAATP